MINEMSWDQYCGWRQYYQLEPFGEERADLRAGIVASTIANVNRDTKRRSKPFAPSDFMPDFDNSRAPKPMMEKSSWERLKATAKSLAKGGSFATNKERASRRGRNRPSVQSSQSAPSGVSP